MDSIAPNNTPMPIAVGLNGLLLSNTSAVLLEGPMPDYISKFPQSLCFDERFELSAASHARLTTFNSSIEADQHDDDWSYIMYLT